ncbi:2'-5' RNA ligase family protein [Modestobacter altitudinis]|uniref:2'-5' RNA ligase family protein n=1 Tax=Modestobacter altitudinis TaxID=2213158 RepID=UPI00110D075A|nr:2'-5' RNA ligase family protein [Modestobacter altitudinis]
MAEDSALSGLVVLVPEAEPVIGRQRQLLDENASQGAPAHVTVLFPFAPPSALDESTLAAIGAAVASVPAFDPEFRRTAWFGDDVLWLAPEDPQPFRELTGRLHAAFPQHPPFEGRFPDAVPHLTVGHRHSRPLLEAAEREVLAELPVSGRATEVVLLARDAPGDRWAVRATFPLGCGLSPR